MSTDVWLSTAVVNVSLTLAGIVVLRSVRRVTTPPTVPIPSDSGTTSRRSMSRRPPERMPAWIPAPRATTSSGSMSTSGGRPKISSIWRRTSGTRVEPPTATTSRTSRASTPASLSAWRHGVTVRATMSRIKRSNSSRPMGARALEACEPPGVLGRLALAVVEVRRHRDHGLADGAPERVLGPALELAQDERRHLGRRHLTALDHETDHTPAPLHEAIPPAILVAHVLEAETHEALHGEDRLEGTIGRELARPPPDDHLAAGQEGDGRRQEPRAGLGFGQHPRAVLAEHGHEAVGGAEINADDPLHSRLPAPTRCRRAASAGMRSRSVAA